MKVVKNIKTNRNSVVVVLNFEDRVFTKGKNIIALEDISAKSGKKHLISVSARSKKEIESLYRGTIRTVRNLLGLKY